MRSAPSVFRSGGSGEHDSVGKMAAKRHALNVTRTLNSKLRGFGAKAYALQQSRSAASISSSGAPRQQRVVVKFHVSRHFGKQKASGSLRRHVNYLERKEASLDGQSGIFYSAEETGLDAREHVKAWTQDRHHFRLVISPENAHKLADMTGYVRKAMHEMERDLKTELDWIAVNHYNTDKLHTHVMIRGLRDNGKVLTIQPAYISSGFRQRAQELATLELGERNASEIALSQDKEVTALRWTSLDHFMSKRLKENKRKPPYESLDLVPIERMTKRDQALPWRIKRRLQLLAKLDLAWPGTGKTWYIDKEFKSKLKALSEHQDVLKQLYPSMGIQSTQVAFWHKEQAKRTEPTSLQGIVIAKGSVSEISSLRWIVLEDVHGQQHYVRVAESEAFDQLKVGFVAEIGRNARRNYQRIQEIRAVADKNQTLYSAQMHLAYLAQHHPELSDEQKQRRVRSAAGYMNYIAGHQKAGVYIVDEGTSSNPRQAHEQLTLQPADISSRNAPFAQGDRKKDEAFLRRTYGIDDPALDAYSKRAPSCTDLHVASLHTLKQQTQTHALTWLDRQMARDVEPSPSGLPQPSGLIRRAISQRQDWLIEQGLAQRDSRGTFLLKPSTIRTLRERELESVRKQVQDQEKMPAQILRPGQNIYGRFRRSAPLHQGTVSIISTPQSLVLVPEAKPQSIQSKDLVAARFGSGRRASIEPMPQQEQKRYRDYEAAERQLHANQLRDRQQGLDYGL